VTPLGPIGGSKNRWTVEPAHNGTCRVITELSFDMRCGLLGRILDHAMM
jgi:ribosome-associated toxin RatA of RatAB toxin-antitoxin module